MSQISKPDAAPHDPTLPVITAARALHTWLAERGLDAPSSTKPTPDEIELATLMGTLETALTAHAAETRLETEEEE